MNNYSFKQYIVDAFTDKVFRGNPAAICLLSKWLSDDMMLNIAKENNLSETAFVLENNNYYELRWFTRAAK
nr:PhzF family phenazine biosynthesis protein [Brachyspira murdochii]